MTTLQQATLEARTRTGRPGLGVAVRAGAFQITETTGRKTRPLSEWVPGPAIIQALRTLS